MNKVVNVLFLTKYPEKGASSRYRVYQYLPFFKNINFKTQALQSDTSFKLMYSKGHFFKKHTDANTHLHRMISIIINLNEGYEGGDLLFHNPSTLKPYSKLQLKTGDMVLFPSNFLYPHEITSLTKGVRYSIVAWLQ